MKNIYLYEYRKSWYFLFMGKEYTPAQRRATEKYKKENYARIILDIPKETADGIKAAARSENISITKYVLRAVEVFQDKQ